MVKNNGGFTLIEVVFAMTLLTIAMLGLASTLAGMTRIISRGNRAATAAIYSQERMERLRAVGCAGAGSGSETREARYLLVWSVTTPNPVTRHIQLVIAYPGIGKTRVDSMETSISCR